MTGLAERARIFAIRPEPGLSATLTAGRELGLPIERLALSRVEPVAWQMPDLGGVDAVLVGSANAFRHGGDKLSELRDLPVHAVGKATARAAREAGFTVALAGEGGLQSLLDQALSPTHFLRLAGAERIALTIPEGITVTERVIYRVITHDLRESDAQGLEYSAIVMLYSASSAAHFAEECDRLGLDRERIRIAALGPRIADAAGDGWRSVHIADRPNDSQLLAIVKDIWL